MKLEDQVAPLALAQRMKELGFPQDTAFVWARRETETDEQVQLLDIDEFKWALSDLSVTVAAPTVAEMLAWLPDDVHTMRRNTSKGMFHVFGDDEDYVGCWGASAAEAIAHKLITVATSAWPSKYHPLGCTLTPELSS